MLTRSQQKTLDFIRQFIQQEGYAPTYPEIAEGIGIKSVGVVHRYVQALIDAGHMRNQPGRHRGLFLNDVNDQSMTLPLLGKIAAGQPIEAIAGEDEINLADFFMGPGRFALRVQGDSMIEAGILDGDIAIIKQQHHAIEGDIVVALIDQDEATLKTYQPLPGGQVRLLPANHQLQPMVFAAERVQIQGVLVGSMRRY